MNFNQLEVLNPVADTIATAIGIIPRPRELTNKRLGLYWNSKPNGDIALLRVAEHLKNRFPNLSCDLILGNRPGIKEKVDEAKRHDVVLSASGD